ncbi:MAG: class II aldolase/adducin family protein [Candidatus Eisenbacteria bacterium]|nr:class II aldolase/adducin family protein [Candidatus Eisenbacteria bacterium]
MNNALEELRIMGERLGKPWWVQGPGGNVSVKTEDGELWVKASGKRLKDVAGEGGFARVCLETALRAVDGDPQADAELFSLVPRPSLETYFHTLPGRVVAHTHSLGVLLLACSSRDGGLGGLVETVPYLRPGRGIALALRDLRKSFDEQVFLLRSHGLVVIAPDAARAVLLTEQIDRRICDRFQNLPHFEKRVAHYLGADVMDLQGGKTRRLPSRKESGSVRYLFPDAAVYASKVQIDVIHDLRSLAENALSGLGRSLVLVDAQGQRAAVARNLEQLDDTCEILAAHDWLEEALGECACYLPDDEPDKVVSMPSEQYRIRLQTP